MADSSSLRLHWLTALGAFALGACANSDRITAPVDPPSLAISSTVCDGTGVTVAECEALVALYNSTGGDDWVQNDGWGTDPNPCDWAFVECEGGTVGPVARLKFFGGNNMVGTLPPELGQLYGLEVLVLEMEEGITGTIPVELSQLSQLNALLLARTHLNGPIPPALGNLNKLSSMNLTSNDLTGPIPALFKNLDDLEVLQLWSNNLSGEIPAELALLSKLERLDLFGNNLTGSIPPELGSIGTLQTLLLTDNSLTGEIPATLGNLTSLTQLWLEGNTLSGGVPAELANLASLQQLLLHDNLLSGLVPLPVAVLGSGINCDMSGNDGLFMPDIESYRAADGDADGFICNVTLVGAEDIGEDAVDELDDLVPDPLNGGQANALSTKIENAIAKADNGQFHAAISQMEAFIAQLGNMVSDGILTAEQAAPFLAQAEALIAIWEEEL